MLSQPWMFLIVSILFSLLLAVFLFFYFRNFILMKQKLLTTETELTKVQETERLQIVALHDLKSKMEATQSIDALTGLITREIFDDRLKQIINQSKRHQLTFGVLFLNFNEFKMITNALGLDVGDQILKDAAKRLLQCIRQLDTAARFSADDFVLILSQLAKAETAAYVAQRLLDAMAEPFVVHGKEIFVAASIGIAIYPIDGDDGRALMKNAEIALHQAKVRGHHSYQFYRSDMQIESNREFILSTSLQNPAVYKDFLIYYQPIIHVEKKYIYAMQTMLRWNHPDCGLLEFNDFSRLAESNGTIIRIGEWLIHHACQQFQEWKTAGYNIQTLVITISLRQLEYPHFIYKLTQLLRELHIEPGSILFEIAENAITSKIGVSEKTLLMLKELGVQIGISEFGTGNMALWRLQGFKADSFKIATSIIKNITVSEETTAIVKMILALAHTLRLQVMAAGVETKKQAQTLKAMGCDLMLGDAFSKPLLSSEFTPLIEKAILESIH